MDEEIWRRQNGLIHPDKLKMPILIVGAGSIGSWTALALSKLGCSDVTVMDGDTVAEHNAGSQIYKAIDSGEKKVVALTDKLRLLTDLPVFGIPHYWKSVEQLKKYAIVIAAVDTITVRRELFDAMLGQDRLYIDGRMAGNAIEIYTTFLADEESCKAYEGTLFEEGESVPVACSERSVVYNVFIVAGLIADLVAKQGNGEKLPPELIVDLFNFTLFT